VLALCDAGSIAAQRSWQRVDGRQRRKNVTSAERKSHNGEMLKAIEARGHYETATTLRAARCAGMPYLRRGHPTIQPSFCAALS